MNCNMKFNIFKKKKSKKHKLLKDYEAGKILQIDNNKNNKEYFKSLDKNG